MEHQTPSLKPFPVSWDEMHRHAKALAWRLNEKGPWQGIIAITRGGLVPAAVIARELDIRLIETLCVSSYDFKNETGVDTQRGIELLKPVMEKTGTGQGWLVVDDLADTGQTLQLVKKILPEAHRATVYAKPAGRPLVESFVIEVSQDTWIYFPWDVELQFVQPIATRKQAP